ncbi:MAG TPA: GDP-mannose 4,6-dehydratase [Elusimicrobiota bacterium]|nr:GDP-mannose 4,6-dehydratase [Elusimicrobiota bacterium]
MEKRTFKRVIITGISGSGGSYLAEHIVREHPGAEVHGLSRWHSTAGSGNLEAIRDRVVLHECDMTDFSSLMSAVSEVKPDAIFHLASHANVRASFQTPLAVLENNIMNTANLLEAVRLAKLDPYIQLCSTSEVYGQVDPKDVPIREDCSLRPSSPYAVSKVAQDLLGWTYFRSYGMKVIRTRMFAYINPRRADLFATSFARQVARIEAGLQKELVHGNLDSVRTLIDVRDAMEAYWVALEHCAPGEAYNIGGTTVIKVGEFLDLLLKRSRVPIKTRQDPALLRPADVTLQIPDTTKFFNATQWKPKHSFEESVELLLGHWRKEIAKEATHAKQDD